MDGTLALTAPSQKTGHLWFIEAALWLPALPWLGRALSLAAGLTAWQLYQAGIQRGRLHTHKEGSL